MRVKTANVNELYRGRGKDNNLLESSLDKSVVKCTFALPNNGKFSKTPPGHSLSESLTRFGQRVGHAFFDKRSAQ